MEEQQDDENNSRAAQENYDSKVVVTDENDSRALDDTHMQVPKAKEDEPEELDLQLPNESIEGVLVKNLCAKDLYGDPKFLWLPKELVEENLLQFPFPQVGEEIILTFRDPIEKRPFTVHLVHADQNEYQIRGRGWEEYVAQHKLESGDFISSYKKNDYYVIYTWKLPNDSIERVPVLVKNLCAKDPNCLRLLKKEVEGNLVEHPFPRVGEEIILPLHDPIGKKSFTVELVHADQEEYHIRGRGWEEYVAQHNLLISDHTIILVNKVILDPTAQVQLVNISYHYEITYQTTATNRPQKKPKPLGMTTENSSAPASTGTTTAVEDSSAPASTATTAAVDISSATASTATTAAVDNSSALASTQLCFQLNLQEEEADDNGEMDFHQEKDIVLCKFLRKTDVGDSISLSIEKKVAEDHLPVLAPGKSQILEFEDSWKNKFKMEFVHTNFGDYYFRTGWERYKDQHKLKYMDLLTVYKKKRKHDDHQCFFVIEHRIVTTDDFQDERTLIMKQVIDIMDDPKTSVLEELLFIKNLGYNDLLGFKLELPKKDVEEYLDDLPIPEVGRKVTLFIFDPIGLRVLEMELVHTEEEQYYLGGKGWEEYVAKHKLILFDTVFIDKVTLNDDMLNSTAECIWKKVTDLRGKLDVQLVNHSYYYKITYERRSAKPQKRPEILYKAPEDSSAPAVKNDSTPDSTTPTGKSNSKGKGVAVPEYDSDDAYWLSYDD